MNAYTYYPLTLEEPYLIARKVKNARGAGRNGIRRRGPGRPPKYRSYYEKLYTDSTYDGLPNDKIDISDVIEVIETDPAYTNQPTVRKAKMYNGIDQHHSRPKCVIIEEPAQKQLRFRYECEGRSAGSIPGANSTPENKTYPTIKIQGYTGKAIVVVSCVTKDEPYRPHPHKLVGREGCKKGVCTVQVPEDTMTVSFQNLGIQCVKKKDIEEALKTREEIRVDPFRTGFSHRNQPTSIDLNAVRLCFQVFLQGEQRGKYIDLAPVVSAPIYDKKAMCDLVIVKLSDCVCPVDGGNKDIILLCEKVAKEDIQIRFFEEKNNEIVWEGFGEFQPSQVHKQTGIWFRPPKYKTLDVIEPVKMFIQLRRPSDNATSAPVPFQMVSLGGKRRAEHSESSPNNVKRRLLELNEQRKNTPIPEIYSPMNIPPMQPNVKDEPDLSRSPFLVDTQYPVYHQHIQFPNIPSTSTAQPDQQLPSFGVAWGGPSASYAMGLANISMVPDNSVTTFIDMDSLKQITINSDDLPVASLTNMSLTDLPPEGMIDSLDRLANNEADRHLAPHQ